MQDEFSYIQQMRLRNPEGLKRIMEIYQDYVYTVLFAMLRSRNDTEEATQDTFVKAYRSVGRFNGESKFSTWLYRIAYRTGLDYIKKRKRFKSLDQMEIPDQFLGIDAEGSKAVERSELMQYLENALMQLKPPDAVIVRLFYLKELSLKEISDVTGMSETNVKVRLFRARKSLKKLVEKHIHHYTMYS